MTSPRDDVCVQQGRACIRPANTVVSTMLKDRRYALVAGPNVDPPMLHATLTACRQWRHGKDGTALQARTAYFLSIGLRVHVVGKRLFFPQLPSDLVAIQ